MVAEVRKAADGADAYAWAKGHLLVNCELYLLLSRQSVATMVRTTMMSISYTFL